MKDVAKKAGVSLSTVSYALSGNRPISAEKKLLIQKSMKELGYRPHAIARSLASKRTRILALVFPPVERGVGLSELSLITCAAQAATLKKYHLVFWSLKTKEPAELHQLLGQELVDGVILMEVRNNDYRIPVLEQEQVPFVLVGQDDQAHTPCYVDTDFPRTMLDALSYLIAKGHRIIGFINQSEEMFKEEYGPVVRSQKAFEQFKGMLRYQGHSFFCPPSPQKAYSLVLEDLEKHKDCTAYIVMNDRILCGVIKAIEHTKRSIPEDFSLVSIVSTASSATLRLPALTTFELQGEKQMSLAVNKLISRLDNTYCELSESLFPCILVERQSSGPVTKEKRND